MSERREDPANNEAGSERLDFSAAHEDAAARSQSHAFRLLEALTFCTDTPYTEEAEEAADLKGVETLDFGRGPPTASALLLRCTPYGPH